MALVIGFWCAVVVLGAAYGFTMSNIGEHAVGAFLLGSLSLVLLVGIAQAPSDRVDLSMAQAIFGGCSSYAVALASSVLSGSRNNG